MRGVNHALIAVVLMLSLPVGAVRAFERTEERADCARHVPLRDVFFGDLHVHTAYSFDANALGVRATPRDAYRFARGEPLGLRPFDEAGRPARRVQLQRPLDFAAVTDHAEMLGEVRICGDSRMRGHDSLVCRLTRRLPLLAYYVVNSAIFNVSDPERYSLCGPDGSRCREAAAGPWREIQAAAEEAYDRSRSCEFTTFVGYEWSGNPSSEMIHRNVVFRNAVVPSRPSNYVDDETPEALWEHLESRCLDAGTGCDVLAIPHNANVSGGRLFATHTSEGYAPEPAWARRRGRIERLFEVTQHKGASECREDGFAADELCAYERLPFATLDQHPTPFRWSDPPRGSYLREVLAAGLALEEPLGVDPFAVGVIGSTDTHEAAPGLVQERRFPGHAAGGDTLRQRVALVPDLVRFNPGGLAAVWAEENSRDALFEAMRRRETYGTSGPRLRVRLFAGADLPADLCERRSRLSIADRRGVPMGSELPVAEGPPRIVVWALRDPDGAPLERIQIVKVWNEDGAPREAVFDVAGAELAGSDPATCAVPDQGADELCAVFEDEDFDPERPAAWYARVLEPPSCRWTQHLCVGQAVRCEAGAPDGLEFCCDGSLPALQRERAWTSPVWWRPRP